MDQNGEFGPYLVFRMLKSGSERGHVGPGHFPTVLQPLPKVCLNEGNFALRIV